MELYEKSDEIGGQLWVAGAPPHKEEIWELVKHFDAMLDKYEVDVFLDTEMTDNLIKEIETRFHHFGGRGGAADAADRGYWTNPVWFPHGKC